MSYSNGLLQRNNVIGNGRDGKLKTVRMVSDSNLQLPVIMIFKIKYCLMSKLKMMYLMIHLLKLSEKTINQQSTKNI